MERPIWPFKRTVPPLSNWSAAALLGSDLVLTWEVQHMYMEEALMHVSLEYLRHVDKKHILHAQV